MWGTFIVRTVVGALGGGGARSIGLGVRVAVAFSVVVAVVIVMLSNPVGRFFVMEGPTVEWSVF